ncbi:MAG: PAS domain S-box protein [Candidatus Sumerlaeia bacterium]
MVQAQWVSALADAQLIEMVNQYDSLSLPFGVLERTGRFLYLNPAFQQIFQIAELDTSLPLDDVFDLADKAKPLFKKDKKLNTGQLPFQEICALQLNSSPSSKAISGLLRLEAFTSAQKEDFVFCTFAPKADAPAPAPLPLVKSWRERIEEIGDSFDIGRIGAKVCKILIDLCEAHATTFYYFNIGMALSEKWQWQRAEQLGDIRYLQDVPDWIDPHSEWLQLVEEKGVTHFSQLQKVLKLRKKEAAPEWIGEKGSGFILPCLSRGDYLGLAIAWTDLPAESIRQREDILELIGMQSAQSIDHARWFQFASRSDSRSAQMIENANALILGLDRQGKVTLWNRKGQEILGYSPEEMLGRCPFHLFGSTEREESRARKQFCHSMESGTPLTDYESRLVDNKGRVHHVIWNTNILSSPQGYTMGLYAIGQDITRRKELERNLEASERRYRNLVETTHDIYWIVSIPDMEDLEKGRLLFMNRALAGKHRQDILGKNLSYLKETFSRESWMVFTAACMEALSSEGPIQHVETEHRNQQIDNGAHIYLMHDIFPYYEEDDLLGLQILTTDITDRKNIEAQMLQAQKLESVGTLARGIAHDFNNVLNGINGFTYLIHRHLEDSEKVMEHSRAILDLTRRAGGLTRQLQAYARGGYFEKRPIDLNDTIRQTVKMLDSGIARNLDVQMDLYEDLDWIEADRSQLEQVLMNLCINAAEAMPDGGMLSLCTNHVHLSKSDASLPSGAKPGDYCRLKVSDTGVGMTPQVRARIFDPFYTTKKTGNGLGLSAVYGILKAHSAWISVESEVHVGTSFTLYFPGVKVKQEMLGEEAGQVRGGSETVMVVDDEEAVRMVAEDILSTLGYRVVVACDGEEAVRIFQERPQSIDLVMMDMAMPKLNGRAAAKAMRMLRPDLKVLFSSGYNDSAHMEILEESGFYHFLPKPFSMRDLQKAVRQVLDDETH